MDQVYQYALGTVTVISTQLDGYSATPDILCSTTVYSHGQIGTA